MIGFSCFGRERVAHVSLVTGSVCLHSGLVGCYAKVLQIAVCSLFVLHKLKHLLKEPFGKVYYIFTLDYKPQRNTWTDASNFARHLIKRPRNGHSITSPRGSTNILNQKLKPCDIYIYDFAMDLDRILVERNCMHLKTTEDHASAVNSTATCLN